MVDVRADLFPAKVVTPEGDVFDPVKVLVGLDRIWVYQVTGNTGKLLHEWMLDDIKGTSQYGYTATVAGKDVQIFKATGCGCGVNKGWRPFEYRLIMSPIRKK